MSELNNDKKRKMVGFFNSFRWSIGEIIGQLLAVPVVIISAYLGFIYQSFWVFFVLIIPLLLLVILLSKKLSGENSYQKEKASENDAPQPPVKMDGREFDGS